MKSFSFLSLTLVLCVSLAGAIGSATSQDDEHAKPQVAERDPIHHLSFMAGTWRGEKDGGLVEEIWSEPRGGAMMGVFRWVNAEGRSRMYEILTISKENDEILLRLRHFTPKLVAWEEKEEPIVMRLSEFEKGRAVFVNVSEAGRLLRIVFHQEKSQSLAIRVQFREGMGEALEFEFEQHSRQW